MGCSCSHKFADNNEPEEETFIQETERNTGFYGVNFTKICEEIGNITANGRVETAKFQDMRRKLKLGSGETQWKLDEFYTNLCAHCSWSSRRLLLLAIILGHGDLPTKSQHIFLLYHHDNSLSASEIDLFCVDLCSLFLLEIPEYTSERLEAAGLFDSAVLIQNYAMRLREALQVTVREYSSRLNQRKAGLSCSEFTELMLSPGFICMFSPKNMRKEALSAYKNVLKEHNKQKYRGRTN